jgi:ribosome-binding protein aMBF1 (putative translation factor)
MRDFLDLPDNYMDTVYAQVGKNVKKARMEKGISQLKLAEMIGHKSVSIVSLAEIYHNKHHFNIEHLVKIAFVLDINVCELLPESVVHRIQKL